MSNEIELHERHGDIAIHSPLDPTTKGGGYWTTLPTVTEADKSYLLRALQSSDRRGEDVIGKEFTLEHLICQEVDMEDPDTGETQRAIRSVLIAHDKERIAFVSTGIFRSLKAIAQIFGPPPWLPPLRVAVTQQRTRRKFLLYQLVVVGRDV